MTNRTIEINKGRRIEIGRARTVEGIKQLLGIPKFQKPKVRQLRRINPNYQRLRQLRNFGNPLNTNPQAFLDKFRRDKERQLMIQQMRENQLSPSLLEQLRRVALIQNKSLTDDMRRQRQRRERALLGKTMSLLNTPYVFNRFQFNITGVSDDNILKSPNIFLERQDNFILRKRKGSFNILDTMGANNNLRF